MKYRVIKNGFFVTDNLSNQGLLSEEEFAAMKAVPKATASSPFMC